MMAGSAERCPALSSTASRGKSTPDSMAMPTETEPDVVGGEPDSADSDGLFIQTELDEVGPDGDEGKKLPDIDA